MRSLIVGLCLIAGLVAPMQAQQDNPECAGKTFDLFTSFQGFHLARCEDSEFKQMTYWIDRGSKEVAKEGRWVKLSYELAEGSGRRLSGLQVIRNFGNAAKAAGGTVVPSSDDMVYRIVKGARTYWAQLSGPTTASAEVQWYNLEIIQEEAMAQELSAALNDGLAANGKVAIYDILFDTGLAVVKPESHDAIKAIADWLAANPTANLYVVGHTDNTGTLPANLKLSKDRAAAVVTYLTSKLGVTATRLTADGVGPLAPVSTNTTDAGRALNRRVEVVLR